MINRFKMTVAVAALIAGTGFANAQGTGMSREAPSAGPAAQQSAPSSDRGTSATPMNQGATEPGMKSTQSQEKSPAAGKNQRADETMQGQKSKSMSSENDNAKGGKDIKAEGREDQKGMKAEGRDGNVKGAAENKGTAENKSQTTTGQAGAGAKLSSDQRTKITTVIKEQHVAPVTNVNFSISVGTRVPHDVAFRPLPAEVVTIYPEWRGYNFILVRDQILVIDPNTFEIVAVIEA
ncbi:DUF1236 domain-containing protein [Bradyrhizobium canariense]|uniref:DUF1236 domain-containing protein n=1 Tax=Bradyrhizobium canariense TaxID=255045 RepID=A0A1H1R2N0_9BRAD|nr:DUF1236 domain-containing protein [Bradyrhizobium canariense]SDS30044.1 Protein of unknown function [Bradyrhizobium canariense]